MKFIQKGPEPQEFLEWKNQANDDWKPTYSDLGGSVKKALKNGLMLDQGFLCCYCEAELTVDESHIEHFRPQSDPHVDALDYSNLLCSCQNNLKKGEPLHCGNLKGDWFDSELLISPLDPNCETRFSFTADGHIQAAETDDEPAKETIKKLGLNIPELRDLRSNAIEPFLLIEGDEEIVLEDMQALVKGYLQPSEDGKFSEFWTTIRYLFGGYV